MTLLTRVLNRALPFKSPGAEAFAYIRLVNGDRYWGIVCRDCDGVARWWNCFKKKYPHWLTVAQHYAVASISCITSPEFLSLDDLLNWLKDVLQLPESVRNLLKIEVLSRLGMSDE